MKTYLVFNRVIRPPHDQVEKIAADATVKTQPAFIYFGFELLDFRIEGSSFDQETNNRIADISNVQADVKAAQLAGVTFEELQKIKAVRDAAQNPNGMGAGMVTAMNLANIPAQADLSAVKSKLSNLKELYDNGLIDENDFKIQKEKILKLF